MENSRCINIAERIDQSPLSKFQLGVIFQCTLIAVLEGFDTQVIAFVAPRIAADWGVDLPSFGPVFAASLAGLMVGALVLGAAGDRFGRKPVMLASFASVGLFTLMTAWAEGMTDLTIYRFLTGIGIGGTMPNALALVSEYAPKRLRATIVTVMYCGFPLGAAIGGFIVAPIITIYDWSSVFVVGGVLPLILSLVVLIYLPESLRFLGSHATDQKRVAQLLGRIDANYRYEPGDIFIVPGEKAEGVKIVQLFAHGRATGTILLWVLFLSNLLMLYLMLNWLPTILSGAGLSLKDAIIAASLFNLGGMIVGVLLGQLIDRGEPYAVIVFTYILAACVAIGLGMELVSGSALFGFVFLAGVSILGPQLAISALAANFYPTVVRGAGLGAALAVGRVGAIIGPLAGGLVLSWGLPGSKVFLLLIGPALLCAGAVYYLGRATSRSSSSTA